MTATHEDIYGWLLEARKRGATHLIIAYDTYGNWTDYPVFVSPQEKVREVAAKYDGKEMQKLMEVYSLSMDLGVQLNEVRAFHYD